MSGSVQRRRPAMPLLAAAMVCALVWVSLVAAISPMSRANTPDTAPRPAGPVVVAPAPAQHLTQRLASRLHHVTAALTTPAQRDLAGPAALAVALLLAVSLIPRLAARGAPSRWSVGMPGVRGPPASPVPAA